MIFLFQWNLFQLSKLEVFDAMLKRLFLQEAERIVLSYENYRIALNNQIERKEREMQSSQKQAMAQGKETKV